MRLLRLYNTAFTMVTSAVLAPATLTARLFRVPGVNSAITLWLNAMCCCLRSLGMTGGIRLMYDPAILNRKRVVIISNHVNYFDWLIVWVCLMKLRRRNVIFCAKRHRSGKAGAGHFLNACMRAAGFIVIEQDINTDNVTLVHEALRIRDLNEYCVVLFPEGKLLTGTQGKIFLKQQRQTKTTLGGSTDSVMRDSSTTDEALKYTSVLPPRTRGFELIMTTLGEQCDAVVDVTLMYAYQRDVEPSPTMVPKAVRVYMRRLDIAFSGADKKSYDRWLREWFVQKSMLIDDLNSGFDVVIPPDRRALVVDPPQSVVRMHAIVPSTVTAITALVSVRAFMELIRRYRSK
ncbi:Lysophospholipid acetyltransferase [Heliothis virescens ascovirus 3i]|nr:Lysophospholipid acetyltransferase [Heliothis virescens ascovirus 3i]